MSVPFALNITTYWFIGLLFLYVDLTGKPSFIAKYKIQPKQDQLSFNKFFPVLKQVLLNQLCISSLILTLFYYVRLYLNGYSYNEPLFEWRIWFYLRVLTDIIVFSLWEEIGFYYSHRLIHMPGMYKRIHKIHHEWNAPIGVTSLHAHPIEHLLCNCIFIFSGPFIMNAHYVTIWVWMCLSASFGVNMHSGYDIPFLPSPKFHDHHHQRSDIFILIWHENFL